MRYLIYSIVVVLFSIAVACGDANHKDKLPEKDLSQAKQPLEKANRYLVVTEEENINNFVRRYGWEMERTGTGLRYMIYQKGDGPKVELGKIVSLNYELRSLTGDLIYSSDEDGIMAFLVGRGGVPTGLEEGIKLLSVGDKAKIILPSHLAYGLMGDDRRIQPKTVLIYDIEVIDLK